jgi:two-component system, cell cycle response regulator
MKILIAEDDIVSRRLLQATLQKWGYEILAANDGVQAWEMLQGPHPPKLVVLDWVMPGLDGVEICRKLRGQISKPYTYILLLTSKGQRMDMLAALDAGADDFISKPFDPHELKGRLRAGERILDLQDELIKTREELHYLATHDSLTRLLNRPAVLTELHRALARGSRQGRSTAIAMGDLDYFKSINDTHGHSFGDTVLCEVSMRMASSLRPYDTIGRYGGEEFLVIFEGCNRQEGIQLAERLRRCISEDKLQVENTSISVAISLGVAATGTAKTEDANSLIRLADTALYKAKNSGRNRVVCAMPSDSGISTEDATQAESIQEAVEAGWP